MSIQRSDMSFLFSGLSAGGVGGGSSNWLSDYASIKNGSYGKLMRAYYGGNDTAKKLTQGNTPKTETTETAKTYAKVQTGADSLKASADKLLDKSLYEGNDTEKVSKAVESFVNSYNSVISSVGKVDDDTVGRRAEALVNLSVVNSKSLQAVGITINEDATLTVDKEALKKEENLTKIKNLFSGNGSYGYQASAQASLIGFAADHASAKGSAYGQSGTYNGGFSTGNLFSGYF